MTEEISKANSKIRCLIVDDESVAIKGIADYINELDFLTVDSTCSSAIEAAEILKNREIDLMFLDINMPHLTGLAFLETLAKAPLTIITTAYSEYALDGYRLNVVDYLLKPFDFQRFFQAVTKARDSFESHNVEKIPESLYIRQGDSFFRIEWKDILFVEAMQNYLKLHIKDRVLVIHQTMASLEERLPKDVFFRIHRSYLVNISSIQSIMGNCLFIDGKSLPISQRKKDDLMNTVVYKNLISK